MIFHLVHFFKGGFDYCANLGGVLPSADFFDLYNLAERPRTTTKGSNDTTAVVEETDDTIEEEADDEYDGYDYYDYYQEDNVDTDITFVDRNTISEKSIRRRPSRRSKR